MIGVEQLLEGLINLVLLIQYVCMCAQAMLFGFGYKYSTLICVLDNILRKIQVFDLK